MELVFEMLNPGHLTNAHQRRKSFGPAGGVIGRGEDCDWVIPDRQRLLSKHHAQVSSREGVFFLTDISGNGTTHRQSGMRLPKGKPVRIQDADAYILGNFEVLVRLVSDSARGAAGPSHLRSGGSLIPDNAFLDLDPLKLLDQQESIFLDIDELITPAALPPNRGGSVDYARVEMENLLLPELVEVPPGVELNRSDASECLDERFWGRFGHALGVNLNNLDRAARESLAITTAQWFKQNAQAYEEQVRLISSLHIDRQG
ncbi:MULTISPECIES: type VI secretion system-associated FHA domain protein TagH [Pseudomonas]|uniref:type VI secretion system-associated FHA domain protein TagH n=1 Tax=Pseudomonas TaxID=286 RepID=UPI001BE9B1FB|nr:MULTISPECIES: type VI secretion system-associated FHA domain protein TagH [Pseudomonas]MBT2337563.1 type VI secretion system-associated FHA domain protein TagH [Pseudomonas fluorescens]MCD4530801.1 type VI secretion system-associated FHA domain protein TagH [Pseudomonas sp. C3-2018]